MFRIALGTMAALTLAMVISTLALVAPPATVQAQAHSASRSFSADWTAPGSEFRVTIAARDYGPFGQVVETLPPGFTYVSSSLGATEVEAEGQTVRFSLFGVSSFFYRVSASTTEGDYVFSGLIANSDRETRTISGNTQVRVGLAPTPTPTPPPTATFTPTPTFTPVPTPTSTATPTATPTTVPTPTPTPRPTATPAPTATATPAPTATPEPTATTAPAPTATPEPTAPPAPTATMGTSVADTEEEGGTPVLVWLLLVLLGVAILAAIMAYLRLRR